jgi:hypothetical protein
MNEGDCVDGDAEGAPEGERDGELDGASLVGEDVGLADEGLDVGCLEGLGLGDKVG